MFRLALTCLSMWFSVLLLGGCAQPRTCTGGSGTDVSSHAVPMPTEMRAERGSLSADVSALGSYEAVDRALKPLPTPTQFRVLRAEESQCLAAANAPLAKLYAAESEAVLANVDRANQQAASVQSRLMAFRAVAERNIAAGMALELFYSLAEAEANRDVLDRSIEKLDHAAANLDQLKTSGLTMPSDRTAIERQKLDAIDRRIQLHAAIRQMQGQLQQLCGLQPGPATPIWPEADLTVTVAPTNVQAAIAEGLANRADLGALKMLMGSLSVDTLPAARSSVQALSPGLGASMIARRLFRDVSGRETELQSRRSQLTQALGDMEVTVEREIGEAVNNVDARLREVAVAKERWEVWRQRVAGLKEKRETNGVTAFDLTVGELELLRVEGDTIHRVAAWKIAQAKLRQAQGLLAAECGYHLPDRCRYATSLNER